MFVASSCVVSTTDGASEMPARWRSEKSDASPQNVSTPARLRRSQTSADSSTTRTGTSRARSVDTAARPTTPPPTTSTALDVAA